MPARSPAAAHDAGDQVPSLEGSPKDSASSPVMACTSTPIQPRVTEPVCMICSMTLRARETGIAKPIPASRRCA